MNIIENTTHDRSNIKGEDNDPFSCFGGDDEDDEEINDTPTTRDEQSCGILAFHPQTESSLLTYVQNNYPRNKSNPSTKQDVEYLLNIIDDYCFKRHWMMHIGPEKRNIIQSELQFAIQTFLKSDCNRFTVVELGTYCGYSAISIGLCLEKARREYPDRIFKLYSFDVDSHFSSIANQMIHIAHLENKTETVLLDEDDAPSEWIRNHDDAINTVNFLFLDHDKSKYTKDLISFESANLLKKGSIVIADNILFAGINDFTHYAKTLEKNGKVTRNIISTKVEYCNVGNEYDDTIEVVTYL